MCVKWAECIRENKSWVNIDKYTVMNVYEDLTYVDVSHHAEQLFAPGFLVWEEDCRT